MLKKLLPVVLLVVGSGAGVGAGIFLRPAPAEEEHGAVPMTDEHTEAEANNTSSADPKEPPLGSEYVKLSNQFVVPIVKSGRVAALVVLSLSVEAPAGRTAEVSLREPKLRDAFLRVLFDHANIGGFEGSFTEAGTLSVLRASLREIGQKSLGADLVNDVLILEIARQDY